MWSLIAPSAAYVHIASGYVAKPCAMRAVVARPGISISMSDDGPVDAQKAPGVSEVAEHMRCWPELQQAGSAAVRPS